jgi:hypothetical protein
MRGNASRYPDKRESAANAKARLIQMLYCCRPSALAGYTPDGLAATHRVPVKDCEYLLIVARQKRAGELAERTAQ